MNKVNELKLLGLLKNNKSIVVDNKLIKVILGFDDVRDFTDALYSWGYTTDFTYRDRLTSDWQAHLRAFLKSYLED